MPSPGLVTVEITGVDETLALLSNYERGVAAAEANAVIVGTNLVYARGIHEGRHLGGGLARRAGGAFYLTRALERIRSTIAPVLAAALPKGPRAVVLALQALGFRVEAEAKRLTPVRSGALRGSLHTSLARRR